MSSFFITYPTFSDSDQFEYDLILVPYRTFCFEANPSTRKRVVVACRNHQYWIISDDICWIGGNDKDSDFKFGPYTLEEVVVMLHCDYAN